MGSIIKGDLIQLALDGQFDVIVHGCNCFCSMGAGIAKSIRDVFPEAYQADLKTGMGDKNKLGTYSSAHVQQKDNTIIIVNGYTQYDFSGPGILVDYTAVQRLFTRIREDFPHHRIGYPKIGAGLARGNWKIISEIINRELKGQDHALVEYVKT